MDKLSVNVQNTFFLANILVQKRIYFQDRLSQLKVSLSKHKLVASSAVHEAAEVKAAENLALVWMATSSL